MEGDASDFKQEDSFEILPHLSEYDVFMDTQKYRFLNKYGNDSTSETNSISTSNVWNISDIEFHDIRDPFASESESDTVLKSSPDPDQNISRIQPKETIKSYACIQELDHHCNTQENSILQSESKNETDLQLVPYSHNVEYPPKKEEELKTESEQNLHLGFTWNNNERIVENISDKIMSTVANHQIVSGNTFNCDEYVNLNRKESSCNSGNDNGVAFLPSEDAIKKKAVVKLYRGRSKSSKRICQAVDNGLKLFQWFQRKRIINTVIDGAKSSFNSFMNLFEMDLNLMLGMDEEHLKLTIVTEETHCKAIEEAFSSVFNGQITFSWLIPMEDSIPALPVGHLAGIQAAEMKIHCARQRAGDTPLISTCTLIYEAIPQRWQMTTVICIDDPRLNLQMHNFTLSTPIPNEYITEVDRCTPASFSHRDLGLAVSLEQAMSNLNQATVKDAQEFLTDCNSHTTMKSAVLVLAGMYKKYTCNLT